LTQTSFILNENNSPVTLNFSVNCALDASKFSCFSPSKMDAITISSISATCATGSSLETRNYIYLGWKDSNYRFTQNATIHRIYSQHLSHANGISSGLIGKNILVRIKLEKPISKEIHNTLKCVTPSGANSTPVTLNNKDDEISCILPVEFSNSVNSGNLIHLKYNNYNVSKSPLYVISFSNFNLN
jgi:hypothetical protein